MCSAEMKIKDFQFMSINQDSQFLVGLPMAKTPQRLGLVMVKPYTQFNNPLPNDNILD